MQVRFLSAFATLPATLQTALAPLLSRPDFPAMLTAAEVNQVRQHSGLDETALTLALLPLAAACSLVPLSHFAVGAIASGESGNLYFGANMEFAGVPLQQTIHAEQCAITHAWLRGETRLTRITVNYTPCGHCRQFMHELNSGGELIIQLPERQAHPLSHYLPDAFGPRDLAVSSLLLDPVDHHYQLAGEEDALVLAALHAANHSHAPYSQAHSGIALESASGQRYAGSYAENAAFNPSLPPLQAALIRLNLAGERCDLIQRAVLVERQDASISQQAFSRSTLSALGCQAFSHHLLP